jgi:hypothetical protein
MKCFLCAERVALARTSCAMSPGWYEVLHPERTVWLCEECYVPDKAAGRRTDTYWERGEAMWAESLYRHEYDT